MSQQILIYNCTLPMQTPAFVSSNDCLSRVKTNRTIFFFFLHHQSDGTHAAHITNALVILRAARSPFSVLLRAARSTFSLGLPGPRTTSLRGADPRTRRSSAGCPGASSAGRAAHCHWNGVAGTHFPRSSFHLVVQVCIQSVVPDSQP